MSKSSISFLLLIALAFGFSVGLPTSVVPHANAQYFENFAPEQRQACMKKVGTFLSSLLSTDGFKDYWTDILIRNRCQQEDIFALDDEIEMLTKELYETDCTVSEFTELQNEIYEKRMEMHYVRYIVPANEDTFFGKDVQSVDFENVSTTLYSDMSERYVQKKKWVNQETFDELWAEWQERYEERTDAYISCDASPWQEVSDKTKELVDTIKELIELFSKDLPNAAKEGAQELAEATKERWEEAGITHNGEFQGVWSTFKGYLKKNVDVGISLIPGKKSLTEIKEQFEAMGQFLTFDSAQEALVAEDFRYGESTAKAELTAKYTLLYGQGNAQITGHLKDKIKGLQLIVRQSTNGDENGSHLYALQKAAKKVKDKQGKTKAG